MIPFSKDEAEKHKIVFYVLPQDLNLKNIDPLLQSIVKQINDSGWVWTAECCQGHPDYDGTGRSGWDHNVRPFVRLVTSKVRFGEMMGLLASSMRLPDRFEPIEAARLNGVCSFETFVWPRPLGPWEQASVYINAHNVLSRNHGIEALTQFAAALQPKPPAHPST